MEGEIEVKIESIKAKLDDIRQTFIKQLRESKSTMKKYVFFSFCEFKLQTNSYYTNSTFEELPLIQLIQVISM